MGRAENRKMKKDLTKRIGKEGLDKLIKESNEEYIKREVLKRSEYFEKIFMECVIEAMLKNGITTTKAKQIARDTENIVLRRCSNNE